MVGWIELLLIFGGLNPNGNMQNFLDQFYDIGFCNLFRQPTYAPNFGGLSLCDNTRIILDQFHVNCIRNLFR